MKYNKIYELINCYNSDDVFDYLVGNLKQTIKGWDYFVDWEKVLANLAECEPELNLLNYLVGKDDIEKEAFNLIQNYPQTIKVIPILLALRDKQVMLLDKVIPKTYLFSNDMSAEHAVEFMKNTGVLSLIQNKNIKFLPDYALGVEVGLDSHARKNRSGDSMENIVEKAIIDMCQRNNWLYISQAYSKKIEKELGKDIDITINKNNKVDFIIITQNKVNIIECNYYGVAGSKQSSVAGQYQERFGSWQNDKNNFIWVTDGSGWLPSKSYLKQAFHKMDTILSLSMLESGILEKIIKNN